MNESVTTCFIQPRPSEFFKQRAKLNDLSTVPTRVKLEKIIIKLKIKKIQKKQDKTPSKQELLCICCIFVQSGGFSKF